MCWRRLHNVLETKWIKRVERVNFLSHFFLLQLMMSEESVYMVVIHSTVGKRAKRMPDTTVETTTFSLSVITKKYFKTCKRGLKCNTVII